jgi:hypothetical protein
VPLVANTDYWDKKWGPAPAGASSGTLSSVARTVANVRPNVCFTGLDLRDYLYDLHEVGHILGVEIPNAFVNRGLDVPFGLVGVSGEVFVTGGDLDMLGNPVLRLKFRD